MELEGSEVKVDQFSADILARDPTNNRLILIENQLENTDHSHLGQILTYLAGLDAQTIIWVARNFNDAHLSAIRWLNQHTVDPFAFFAVRVKVIRIGDDLSSPAAPLFEVLERPSEWDRQVHSSQERSNCSDLATHRNRFWTAYVQQYPEDLTLRPDHKDSNVYHHHEGLVISQHISRWGVGIYLRPEDGDRSEESEQRIQDCTVALASHGLSPHTRFSIDPYNRANWPQMMEWLHEHLLVFRDLVKTEGDRSLAPLDHGK